MWGYFFFFFQFDETVYIICCYFVIFLKKSIKALEGVLRVAKAHHVIDFNGGSDPCGNDRIRLLLEEIPDSGLDTCTLLVFFSAVKNCGQITLFFIDTPDTFAEIEVVSKPVSGANAGARRQTIVVKPQVVTVTEEHDDEAEAVEAAIAKDKEEAESVIDVLASLVNIVSVDEPATSAATQVPSSQSTAFPKVRVGPPSVSASSAASATQAPTAHSATLERALMVPESSQVMGRRLSVSVKNGELTQKRALAAAQWVDKEIRKLIAAMIDLGAPSALGIREITFGRLFAETAQLFEALSGTLKTAKKKKVVSFATEMLLQGAHDNVIIVLLTDHIPDATIETCAPACPLLSYEACVSIFCV